MNAKPNLVELGEAIGLSQDQIVEKVIDRLVGQGVAEFDHEWGEYDEEGGYAKPESAFVTAVQARVREAIDAAVDKLAEDTVFPAAEELIRGFVLKQTTAYGERRGEDLPFADYLVKRADDWMNEPVDYQGKTRAECRYDWRGSTTRFSFMIDQHLQYSLGRAIEKIYKQADEMVSGGLKAAVLAKLEELSQEIKITVDTTRKGR